MDSNSSNPALEADTDLPEKANYEWAQFAAGCFWGVELALQRVEGVVKTEVGYSQGHAHQPTYPLVCTGNTNHAEVVRLQFDPIICPYTTLLQLFWSRHDPTTLNRQFIVLSYDYPWHEVENLASMCAYCSYGALLKLSTSNDINMSVFTSIREEELVEDTSKDSPTHAESSTLIPTISTLAEPNPIRPVTWAKFSAMFEMMKNLQQQFSRTKVNVLQYQLTYTPLELASVPIAPPTTISPTASPCHICHSRFHWQPSRSLEELILGSTPPIREQSQPQSLTKHRGAFSTSISLNEPLLDYISRFNAEARRVPRILIEVYMPTLI
ncbi:hypothetical protein ACLOJK_009225 [Asimina triloba]